MQNPAFDPGLTQKYTGTLRRVINKDGTWEMTEAIGNAGPGQSLFGDAKDAPALKVSSSARRLSTRYTVALALPPQAGEIAKPH